ncbi:10688_t:CDS:2, partial [Acaulospora colombiana]
DPLGPVALFVDNSTSSLLNSIDRRALNRGINESRGFEKNSNDDCEAANQQPIIIIDPDLNSGANKQPLATTDCGPTSRHECDARRDSVEMSDQNLIVENGPVDQDSLTDKDHNVHDRARTTIEDEESAMKNSIINDNASNLKSNLEVSDDVAEKEIVIFDKAVDSGLSPISESSLQTDKIESKNTEVQEPMRDGPNAEITSTDDNCYFDDHVSHSSESTITSPISGKNESNLSSSDEKELTLSTGASSILPVFSRTTIPSTPRILDSVECETFQQNVDSSST